MSEKPLKEPKVKKPKSKVKWTIFSLIIVLVIAAAGIFVIYPAYKFFHDGINLYSPDREPDVAKDVESIDYNPESGELYVNDEIIVMTFIDTEKTAVESLASGYGAEITESLEDIGFYRFQFADKMTYDELNSLLKKIKNEEIVEDAYINYVFEAGSDAEEEEEFQTKDPLYPNDPWGNDSWNMDVPGGKNWGAEAVRAPAAWGYTDELSPVKVGLIDSMLNTNHEDISARAYMTLTDKVSTLVTLTSDVVAPSDHGTHVAATIGGEWNNVGVSGIAGEKASVYYSAAYYVRDDTIVQDYYDAFNYIAAIRALVNIDVKVINISQNTSRLIGFAASKGNVNAINHLQQNAKIAENGIKRLINNGNEFVICVAAGNSNNTTYYKDDNEPYGYKTQRTWWKIFDSGEKGDSEAKYNNFLNLISDETVKDRIIVVGSVGIDSKKSTNDETRYKYSSFSNIGDRVDIVGPGENIYSAYATGYDVMSGTSMATPHVTGVAGLVFAANPDLTGAEVKDIVLASASGRFYYTGGYSGMVNAETAVIYALKSRDSSVNRVINSDNANGLDICFVVDTTGSMGDDIDNAKANMARILEELDAKTDDYRIALIDYRDFPERTSSKDYAAKVQLDFSDNKETITEAIYGLTLGDGGDTPETVFSALMTAVGLDWRPDAAKAVIILGDAPPLDPEPYTEYTMNQVMAALYNADLAIDVDESDDRVLGEAEDSLIKVFSIGTDASTSAEEFFQQISGATGGAYTGVESAEEVSDAIISSIDKIEVIATRNVNAQFGEDYSDETVEIFKDGEFLFEIDLNDMGEVKLENMLIDSYEWKIPRLMLSGTVKVSEKGRSASIDTDDAPWYQFAVMLWQRQKAAVIGSGVGALLLIIILCVAVHKIKNASKRRRQPAEGPKEQIEQSFPEPVNDMSDNISLQGEAEKAEDNTSSGPEEYICGKCGAKYDKPVNFCEKCGTKMK